MNRSFTNKIILALLIISGAFLFYTSCSHPMNSSSYVVFGTECRITLPVSDSKKYFDILKQMEKKFSYRDENSEIAKINKNAGIAPVAVSDEVFYVISEAMRFSAETDGVFNPLLLPVIKLWGWDTGEYRVPTKEELERYLPLCDTNNIVLNENDKSVFLTKKGMGLDLGGLLKGYACDVLYEQLKKDGIKKGILNLGGNVFVFGNKEYKVAIQKPYAERGVVADNVFVKNKSVVTSGAYERGFYNNGNYYHHIIDPSTGECAKELYKSVTIVSSSSLVADVYSTAIFVKGDKLKSDFLLNYHDAEVIFN